jgi:hypothetical protein
VRLVRCIAGPVIGYPCVTMSEQHEAHERSQEQVRLNWMQRRREKIYQEIQANRRGEYTVPTWVLAVILAVIVVAWVTVIVVS